MRSSANFFATADHLGIAPSLGIEFCLQRHRCPRSDPDNISFPESKNMWVQQIQRRLAIISTSQEVAGILHSDQKWIAQQQLQDADAL